MLAQLDLDAFEYEEPDDIEKLCQIGEGSYGTVYKVRSKTTGEIYAMKRMKMDAHNGITPCALREVAVLQQLQEHPNIVKLEQVIMGEDYLYLIFEYMTIDLSEYMRRIPDGAVMDEDSVKSFFYQITHALQFCHQRQIMHRDIKPANLLISGDIIKLADFGLARLEKETRAAYTETVVTLWYRSPEILLGEEHYSTSVDIWSAGCVFAEMATGTPLFSGLTEFQQLATIFKILGTPTTEEWSEFTEMKLYSTELPVVRSYRLAERVTTLDESGMSLLQATLIYDPKKRITAKEMLAHPYFCPKEEPSDGLEEISAGSSKSRSRK
uniref:Protein kinase domain-containing protein n=1 Tax=Trichuris muris TaxID=70415 RepID=A0A5S6QC24_TRIMR